MKMINESRMKVIEELRMKIIKESRMKLRAILYNIIIAIRLIFRRLVEKIHPVFHISIRSNKIAGKLFISLSFY